MGNVCIKENLVNAALKPPDPGRLPCCDGYLWETHRRRSQPHITECEDCGKKFTHNPVIVTKGFPDDTGRSDEVWEQFVGIGVFETYFCSEACADDWCYYLYCK